jgi:hypothetical protein
MSEITWPSEAVDRFLQDRERRRRYRSSFPILKEHGMSPSREHGKICYIEIPATDVERSSSFYAAVFGWKLRKRSGGQTAFDDATGAVSGTWVLGRPPSKGPGLLVYIKVDSVEAAVDAVVAQGGDIVQKIGVDAPELTARFRDPGGNVIGLYQEPTR